MIIITIDNILKKQKRSKYWLIKNTNITYQAITKLIKNETTSISFENLEKICKALNCTPNDIIKIK